MKTLSYSQFDLLEVSEQQIPTPKEDEVLLKVAACGICGSELESFKTRSPRRRPPLVMGHEFCGQIVGVGAKVTGWNIGQKVVSNSLVPCGKCVRCQRGNSHLCAHRVLFGMHRMGAFAEYVSVPANCLLVWPEGVPAQVVCLAEPLANGVHMVNLTQHLKPRSVLVIGAGPIGLMAQQAFAIMLGADLFVADFSADRLEVARRLGATTINPKDEDLVASILDLTQGEGVDLVVDAVGAAKTKRQSLEATRPGGAVVWIGLQQDNMELDSYDVTLSEKQIFGTYAAKMEELQTALDLMQEGTIDISSWVHVAPLEEGVNMFERMLQPQGDDIKGVILAQEVLN